jgi:hypothetical protein
MKLKNCTVALLGAKGEGEKGRVDAGVIFVAGACAGFD